MLATVFLTVLTNDSMLPIVSWRKVNPLLKTALWGTVLWKGCTGQHWSEVWAEAQQIRRTHSVEPERKTRHTLTARASGGAREHSATVSARTFSRFSLHWNLRTPQRPTDITDLQDESREGNVQFMNRVYYHGYTLSERASETRGWDSAEYLLKRRETSW